MRPVPHRRRSDLIWVFVGAGVMVLSLGLLPYDRAWSDAIAQLAPGQSVPQRILRLPYFFFARWGFAIVPLVLLAYRNRLRLLIGFGATMAAGATIHLLKFLVGRERPDLGHGPFAFHPFGDPRLQYDSFPSAHAAFAVMLAALLGVYYPRWRAVLNGLWA